VKYELQGRVSTVCEECESVNVLVEHEPPERSSESWDEAIERFHEQTDATDGGTAEPDEETPESGEETGEPDGGTVSETRQVVRKVSGE
jgi:5,10-methylenetetrahydrofolate reductase